MATQPKYLLIILSKDKHFSHRVLDSLEETKSAATPYKDAGSKTKYIPLESAEDIRYWTDHGSNAVQSQMIMSALWAQYGKGI